MKKVVIISGPTATGKTSLALKLAKQFNGELISADSRQVYKDMDIVTGKDLPNGVKFEKKHINISNLNIGTYDFGGIPVWGLDLVYPDQEFSISHFYKFIKKILNDVFHRGKLPIIVGGTGFYIKSLWQTPSTFDIPPNCSLRNSLALYSVDQLQNQLKSIDNKKFVNMNYSDKHNPRRLIRAIEVAEFNLINSNNIKKNINNEDRLKLDLLHFNLFTDISTIEKNIKQRVLFRFNNGAVNETKNILNKYNPNLKSMSALGYKEIQSFIKKEINKMQLINLWSLHEFQYAKRQITWFKKVKNIKQINISSENYLIELKLLVQNWLEKG